MLGKKYKVHSIVGPTIEGEGSLVGTPVIIVRFSGCNMWNGIDTDRASSRCPFCDTDFIGGTKMTAQEIVDEVDRLAGTKNRLVSLTGGEPMLQVDRALVEALRPYHLKVETNGTRRIEPFANFYICMSPKVPIDKLKIEECDDLKVLWGHPNPSITPAAFSRFPARHKFVSVLMEDDGTLRDPQGATQEAIRLGWRVSVQTHKLLEVA